MILDSELNTDKFLNIILSLVDDETERNQLGANLNKLAKPEAAKTIIKEMAKILAYD